MSNFEHFEISVFHQNYMGNPTLYGIQLFSTGNELYKIMD